MTAIQRYSLGEAAEFLRTTEDVVLRMVLEEHTLTAIVVGRHGGDQALRLAGLQAHKVTNDGAVTDWQGRSAGNLRFELAELVRALAQHSNAVAEASNSQVLGSSAGKGGGPTANETSTELPMAERRLKRLRELGGSAKRKDGCWRFSGITRLVKEEKDAGYRRCDEKTIRRDLAEAAETERTGTAAGPFSGLHNR